MGFFNALEHYFGQLYPHNAGEAQHLAAEISPFVNLAGPLVEAVERDLKPFLTADRTDKAQRLNGFLAHYIHDAEALASVVNCLLAQPDLKVVLRDTAKAALALLLPPETGEPLNLVIEDAYVLFVVRAKKAAGASSAPVIA